MPTSDETSQWPGRTMIGGSGEAIGTVTDIFLSAGTQEPVWALVQSGSGGSSFIPLAEASQQGESVRVPYEQATIANAPGTASKDEVTEQEAAQLQQHYGAVGTDVSGPTTDDAMTRSEEEVQIGTRSQEIGTARLSKQIITEDITQTVPLRHETVRVESEPITDDNIDDANSGGDLTEEEHEVTLVGEEVDVQKQVVPKERVRLEKDTVTEDTQVTEQARKEEIAVQGVDDAGNSGSSRP